MTFVNFLIGLPVMLLCLIVQTAVAFWCVRHYASHLPQVGSGQGFLAGMRPLMVATLAMLGGTLVQIMLWAHCSCGSASSSRPTTRSTTRR